MKKLIIGLCILLYGTCQVSAQVITSSEIDSLTELTLKTFDVPGIAVAVVKDGKVVHAKGYGVQSLSTGKKVDEHTLFGIASNSKAFTTAALGILMDEGKLKWDSKVIDFIPEFKLYNPYVTAEFTIRDLLTHRSGLGLGAGDLMIWPDSTDFTKQDIIHNLRYLKATSSFRSKYDYDNLLYIVAGEVVARVSGMSWEDFIEKRIMHPLNMTSSVASLSRVKDRSMLIDPHAPVNGKVEPIKNFISEQANAAGGIWSNLTDMCKWVTMQLNDGKYGDSLSKKLFSLQVHDEMWVSQTNIPVYTIYIPYKTHFSAYGLGWVLSDVKGYKQVMHTGGLAGIVTQVLLIPELKLGIIVLTNQQVSAAFTAISNTIKDSYLGIPKDDWVVFLHNKVVAGEERAKKITNGIWKDIESQQGSNTAKINLQRFTGTYTDQWFGDVIISVKNGKLWFDAKRSAKLSGEMIAYNDNTFIAKWNDRSMDADAYVMFSLDMDGKTSGIKMKPISPLTDFSFDFQDLDFKRTK
ncbi:serine hydrolase [Chitinophaga sp. RAB17]|uniref:serine hydrolase n=1 Tax=Chitinophaga sp. RAB17 TaxID=3233049 RepID=UPI003F8E009F